MVHGDRVLLHRHPKQRLWLPPGGHIERDELPHIAAVREVLEETGLRIRLHSEDEALLLTRTMQCEVIPQPAFILLEDINPYHQHIDFTYFALYPGDQSSSGSNVDGWPHNGFDWFLLGELDIPDVPENVRVGSTRAIQYFAARQETR